MNRIAGQRALALTISIWLVACGDQPIQPPPPVADVNGLWDFIQTVVRSGQIAVCRDTGSFRLAQFGQAFSGNGSQAGTCDGLLASFPDQGTVRVTQGQVNDSSVQFTIDDGCGCIGAVCTDLTLIGTVSEGPPRQMSGVSACSINFNGFWEASPASPVASVTLSPDSAKVVVGESIFLTAEMRRADGNRVFERQVSWSTSDSLVAVSTSEGQVTSTGSGVATISVSVEDQSGQMTVTAEFIEFATLEAGLFHSCGILTDGSVYCWGVNDQGQAGPSVGLAPPCPGFPCRFAPAKVPATVLFTDLAAGFLNTCGLASDGSAHCWGVNSAGQLGIAIDSLAASSTPVAVSGGLAFDGLAIGGNHVCGVEADGTAHCWGVNDRDQLGVGSIGFSSDPVPVSGGLAFTSLSAGERHTCALTDTNAAYCWGFNFFGQLGVDSIIQSGDPVIVVGGLAFDVVASGREYNCGLISDGSAHCWGHNDQRQLGIDIPAGTTDPADSMSITPVSVSGGLTFMALATGAHHACGLTAGGSVHCWGRNVEGQLGAGFTSSFSATPEPVQNGLVFAAISAGWEHTCGMTTGGVAYCWGSNLNGQLGSSSFDDSSVPIRVVGQQ